MKKLIALTAVALALGASSAANARVNVDVNVGAPVYAAPAYAVPAPVVVAQPYCREFEQDVVIGNRVRPSFGTACQMPDGSWQMTGPTSFAPPAPTVPLYYIQPQPLLVGGIIVGPLYDRAHWNAHRRDWGRHWEPRYR